MVRGLKHQILRDNHLVFHNPKDFAEKLRLEYQGRTLEVWGVMEEEGTAVRDKNNNQRKNDREKTLYQYDKYIWLNQQDLKIVPKAQRNLTVNGVAYMIREVSVEFGEVLLTVRRLTE